MLNQLPQDKINETLVMELVRRRTNYFSAYDIYHHEEPAAVWDFTGMLFGMERAKIDVKCFPETDPTQYKQNMFSQDKYEDMQHDLDGKKFYIIYHYLKYNLTRIYRLNDVKIWYPCEVNITHARTGEKRTDIVAKVYIDKALEEINGAIK